MLSLNGTGGGPAHIPMCSCEGEARTGEAGSPASEIFPPAAKSLLRCKDSAKTLNPSVAPAKKRGHL